MSNTTPRRRRLAVQTRLILSELRHPVRIKYFRSERSRRPLLARGLYAFSLPVILVWVAIAGVMNVGVPQLENVINRHAESFIPDSASSVKALEKMGEKFGGGGSNNFVYFVIESNHPLDAAARGYYGAALKKLEADTGHVSSALDLWSNPQLYPAAQSADSKLAFALITLKGNMGTALAMESTRSARHIITEVARPPGLQAHITGPSAVVNDELVSIAQSILLLIALCAVFITVVLIIVYRSIPTALIPLTGVGVSLAVARATVSIFGDAGLIKVSIFAAALSAVVVLGAGTNYAIFLIGRYQESRRAGLSTEDAYYAAIAGVQHVIIASALTVAGAMACLTLTRLAIFTTSGLPCTIAILVTLVAALTLGPALLAVASRAGLLEPRGQSQRRWRRIATVVARWPAPVLTASLAVLFAAIAVLPFYTPSYDERAVQPTTSPANVGIAAADRHLPQNAMTPSVVIVESGHDMRDPADLVALSRLVDSIAGLDGVNTVQAITRPLTAPLEQATLTNQADYIGNRFAQLTPLLQNRITDLDQVDISLNTLSAAVDGLQTALTRGSDGLGRLTAATTRLQRAATTASAKVRTVQRSTTPVADLLSQIPQCRKTTPCQDAITGLSLLDDAARLDQLTAELSPSIETLRQALPTLSEQLPLLRSTISTIKATLAPVRSTFATMLPQIGEVSGFLAEVRDSYAAGAPGSGFFLPSQALQSPVFQSASKIFFSADGTATRLIILPEASGFSRESMDLSAQIISTATTAMKGTSLAGSTVTIGGPGGTLLNIESFAHEDFLAIVIAALAFVFCVVIVLLRSFIAACVVIGTVALSFASALGLSVFVWQFVIGQPLHWSVTPVAFTFLVAVGADYNMLLVSRFKEEVHAGTGTGLIRAMVGTGRVVTVAGLTFGVTMLAMLGGTATNIAQIGSTVAIGLLVDTLVVRSLVVPSIARLLGRWFWWPRDFVRWPERRPR